MSVGARDVERQNASIRVAFAIGDLVVLDGFRDVLAGSQVFRQRVSEFAPFGLAWKTPWSPTMSVTGRSWR